MPITAPYHITSSVTLALAEDIGDGDVTAQLIDAQHHSHATLICREAGTLCGTEWFNQSFLQLDHSTKIKWNFSDGDLLKENDILCTVMGNTRVLLTAERTALNFLQTLSGTASLSAYYSKLIASTKTKILDTRKTIPGLRLAQKYAVKCGGGYNHRIGLYDAILIKENHIIAAGSIHNATATMRQLHPSLSIETEVESLSEFEQAIAARVDRVLLDNFTTEQLAQAVAINNSLGQDSIQLEASGGVTDKTILAIAETGVDFISVGAITKHLQALDLSLRIND
ncbi:Quinolinate phosphoribosyltransferase [decarboxylating] [hydrothermal vent metagenome]|uniref:Probable nicotinate-nucleotide pyrophosphorylase [carboxylating] n=1 Tax=hydrothermal vent metagenome TaxID=652676 RepID=A0A3B0YT00_9ZZZZ